MLKRISMFLVALAAAPAVHASDAPAPAAEAKREVVQLTALDYFEIYNLYAQYARALDLGDGPGRVATFTRDGTFSSALSKHVPERMDVVGKRTSARGNSGARHLVNNIVLTATADGVDGFCYLTLIKGSTERSVAFTGHTGFYVDKLVKTAEGWRFKSRETWDDFEPDSPYRPNPVKQ